MTTPREPGWTEEQDREVEEARPLHGVRRGGRCPEMASRWAEFEAAILEGPRGGAIDAGRTFLAYLGERADKRRGDYRDVVRLACTVAASVEVGMAREMGVRGLLSTCRGAFFRLPMRGARGQATLFKD